MSSKKKFILPEAPKKEKKPSVRFDGSKYSLRPPRKTPVRKDAPPRELKPREKAIERFKEVLAAMDKALAAQGRLLSAQNLPPTVPPKEADKFLVIIAAPYESPWDNEYMSGRPPFIAEDDAGWQHSIY